MTVLEIVRALDLCMSSSFADKNGKCKKCPYKCDFECVKDYTMVPKRLLVDAATALRNMDGWLDWMEAVTVDDGEHEAD